MKITPEELNEFVIVAMRGMRTPKRSGTNREIEWREAHSILRADIASLRTERDMALKTIEAMRPVVDAAVAWAFVGAGEDGKEVGTLSDAIVAYRLNK